MAKNDFLPFATADGANVLSADEYQKLTSRSNGFSAGVARSQELNTVWWQASVIAHVVAQFIADTNNSDVADNGDLDALKTGLISALSKNVSNTVPAASTTVAGITKLSSATNSNDETMAATPKAVKAAYDMAASSAVKSVNGKKGEVRLTPDDIGAFSNAGGTVNGDILSQGGQIGLKGDNRKNFILANADGKVCAFIWKNKGGDGVHINNGIDGGGDYIFHKDGGFRSPSSLYAGAARMASDGNIYGSMWGNQWLDAYLKKTFQPKGAGQAYTKAESDARYVRDVQRGAVSKIYTPESTSTDAPKGCVMVGVTLSSDGSSGTHVYEILYRPLQIKINGEWRTISDITYSK